MTRFPPITKHDCRWSYIAITEAAWGGSSRKFHGEAGTWKVPTVRYCFLIQLKVYDVITCIGGKTGKGVGENGGAAPGLSLEPRLCTAMHKIIIMRPSSLGGGRILRCTLSVRLSVCLSVRPVIITERHVAPPSELK